MRKAQRRSLIGHEVIICTRNRPRDLESALLAIGRSTCALDVLVVDSSDSIQSRDVVCRISEGPLAEWNVRYLHTEPGLPLQRNIGLDHSSSSIVHFIDDDADVSPTYFEYIAQAFEDQGRTVVGVGGVQEHVLPRKPNRLRLLAQLEARPGRVSRSAVNNMVTIPSPTPVEVDWLSGCAMSYRTKVARETRFDESLIGYALGEDVEFSLRIGYRGKLLIETRARVDHKFSDVNRYDLARVIRETVVHRQRLISRHPDRFSWWAYGVSISFDAALYFIRMCMGRRSAKSALNGLAQGVVQSLRSMGNRPSLKGQ